LANLPSDVVGAIAMFAVALDDAERPKLRIEFVTAAG